jgi:uncharacterized protein (DUF58 family)
MVAQEKNRSRASARGIKGISKGVLDALLPREGLSLTLAGFFYVAVSIMLLITGLWQQVNLILLVFTLTAGPFLASIFGGRSMLRKLSVQRRTPAYVFSGEPFAVDYTLENGRRWHAALAVFLGETLVPLDRVVSGANTLNPRVFFPRVPGTDRLRIRWQGIGPRRGRYRFRDLELGTRSPFGFVEHRSSLDLPQQLVVYPKLGQLSRRWYQLQRQATENRRGKRHDRSAQQIEYHGLRDYRSGDSPRWIHWRTTARRGVLTVKEFEQQNEQDLAILVDPWLPRNRATQRQKDLVEEVISFASSICLETCRHQGRRLVLGWTGPSAGVRQGPASVKLLHELLEQLAVMRPATEGGLAELFDVMPPSILRESHLIVIATRPVYLVEEAEKSSRMSGNSARGLMSRAVVLNAANGDLASLFQSAELPAHDLLQHRGANPSEERVQGGQQRGSDQPLEDGSPPSPNGALVTPRRPGS